MMYYFMSEFVYSIRISILTTAALIRGMSVRCTRRFFGIRNDAVMSEHILPFSISILTTITLIRGMSVRCTRRFFSIRNNAIMSEYG